MPILLATKCGPATRINLLLLGTSGYGQRRSREIQFRAKIKVRLEHVGCLRRREKATHAGSKVFTADGTSLAQTW